MKGLLTTLFALLLCAPAEACCSVAPASFSSTRGLASEAMYKGKLVHLLGYQNTAKNLVGGTGGNAMLLPIPAKPGTMTESNIFDTSHASHFLEDIEESLQPPPESNFTLGFGSPKGCESAPVRVFDHDIYTIVLASDASQIPAALSRVPQSKRPKLNPEIFNSYGKWYKGWTFALCCFNNTKAQEAKPMLWWYEPNDPATLFFPALDAHTGHAPDLKASVTVDHTIGFGSSVDKSRKFGPSENHVNYRDFAAAGQSGKGTSKDPLAQLLPAAVVGKIMAGNMPNGDFVMNVKDVVAGRSNIMRKLPPGAGGKQVAARL